MIGVEATVPLSADRSVAKTWLRALELTAPIPQNPNRVLPAIIEELAAHLNDSPALLSERESLTYRELAERSNQYARWALDQGIAKGEVVCLLMTNRPEYFAIWLGITSVGGVVALLNTNLIGPSLVHCIDVVSSKHLIVAGEFIDALTSALSSLTAPPEIWIHGIDHASYQRIDLDIERRPG